MKITMIDSIVSDNFKEGMQLSGDIDLTLLRSRVERNGGAGIRADDISPLILQRLGLPADTPRQDVADLLKAASGAPPSEQPAAVKASKLWKHVKDGAGLIANVMAIVSDISA
jgi:hypothetical protein